MPMRSPARSRLALYSRQSARRLRSGKKWAWTSISMQKSDPGGRRTLRRLQDLLQDSEGERNVRGAVGEGHEVVGGALEQQSPSGAARRHRPGDVLVHVVEEAHLGHSPDAGEDMAVVVLQAMQSMQQLGADLVQVRADLLALEHLQ